MKNMIKYINRILTAVVAISAIAFVSCDDSEDHYIVGNNEVVFAPTGCTDDIIVASTQGYIGEKYLGSVTYDMYTRGHWTIEVDYSECFDPTIKWVSIWPDEGDDDGQFQIKSIDANAVQGDTRTAIINIKKGGKIARSIKVNQAEATTKTLFIFRTNITFDFADDATIKRSVPVNANVAWDLQLNDTADGEMVDWVHITDVTKGQFNIACDANFTGVKRSATITVYQVSDPDYNTTVTVNQTAEGDVIE